MTEAPSVTVVICTHNRKAFLARALDSLAALRRPAGKWDILVVANACSDGTEPFLAEMADRYEGLRWLAEPRPGKSHALNAAIAALASAVAVFVDDDQRVAADFAIAVEGALAGFPSAGVICGRLLPDWDGTEPAWVHDDGPYRIYPPPVAGYSSGPDPRPLGPADVLPPGGDLIVRREVFSRVGGFAPGLGPRGHDLVGGEDAEFLRRAIAAGEQIAYSPDIVQYHAVSREQLTTSYLVRKSFQRTRSVVRLESPPLSAVPLYLWNKLLRYTIGLVSSLAMPKRRRFYLVRIAAAVGEIQGIRDVNAVRRVNAPGPI